VQKLAEAFYLAAWDLAERICLLPEMIGDATPAASPDDLAEEFKHAALPFLDLSGADVPKEFHQMFDHVDTITRQEILPALEVLGEEWESLLGNRPIGEESIRLFAEKCIYVCHKVELEVIPVASELEKRIPAPK
jgi:hypothetical protein